MKSIKFTKFREKLLSEEKQQTIRCLFIPQYEVDERVRIIFDDGTTRETLYTAMITEMYPKQLKDITDEEAIRDGFNTKEECIRVIKEINNIKSSNHWCFVIKFDRKGVPKNNLLKTLS